MLNQSVKKIIFIILIACSFFCYSAIYADDDSNYSADYPAGVTINGNLWDDIQDHLQLPDYSNIPSVQKQIIWFQRHQGYLNYIIKKSAPYMYYIYQLTVRRNLPAELALLPIIESGYNPFGYSNVGANGLWQMMPGTASGLGIKINWWYDGRRDLVASTNAAFNYFAYLNDFFTNDWLLAIAAYDCGEGTVQQAIKYNKKHDMPTAFWYLHLPEETRVYVPKLLALSVIIRDPDRYDINLMPINNAPYLSQVNVDSQIDLSQAARLADISVGTIRTLNPGFRRWATDPDGPFTLLIPANKTEGFRQRLDALPKSKRVTWREHTVKKGDSLSFIAHKNKTNTGILREVNDLKDDIIHPGQNLLIPVAFRGSIKSPILKEHTTITEERMPGPHRVVHLVKNGETLWTVAEKYGVTVRELRFWNSLENKNTNLLRNQKLLIWAPSHTKSVNKHNYTYKVGIGDSLSIIAHRFNSTPAAIRNANHLKNNMIRPKQTLTIPGRSYHVKHSRRLKHKHKIPAPHKHYLIHIVRKGDNLKKIAHEFHVATNDLKKWNNLEKAKYLQPGQKIYVYYQDKTH